MLTVIVILMENLALIKLGLFRAVQECLMTNSPYRRCQCEKTRSLIARLERFTLTYSKPENGSILLGGMKTMQEIIDEDQSLFKDVCLASSRSHFAYISGCQSLTVKVRNAYQELDIMLCVRELKNKDGCDAKHARLTVAGPTN